MLRRTSKNGDSIFLFAKGLEKSWDEQNKDKQKRRKYQWPVLTKRKQKIFVNESTTLETKTLPTIWED